MAALFPFLTLCCVAFPFCLQLVPLLLPVCPSDNICTSSGDREHRTRERQGLGPIGPSDFRSQHQRLFPQLQAWNFKPGLSEQRAVPTFPVTDVTLALIPLSKKKKKIPCSFLQALCSQSSSVRNLKKGCGKLFGSNPWWGKQLPLQLGPGGEDPRCGGPGRAPQSQALWAAIIAHSLLNN